MCLRQFDSYKVENLSVNGKLVAGESIADLGGLGIAYDAFQNTLKGQPRPKAIDGLTPEQRFFLGYAVSRLELFRPEAARLEVTTGPLPYRASGPTDLCPICPSLQKPSPANRTIRWCEQQASAVRFGEKDGLLIQAAYHG